MSSQSVEKTLNDRKGICEHEQVYSYLLEHDVPAELLKRFGDNCSKTVSVGKGTWKFPNNGMIALRRFNLCRNCLSDVLKAGIK